MIGKLKKSAFLLSFLSLFYSTENVLAEAEVAQMLGVQDPAIAEAIAEGAGREVSEGTDYERKMDQEVSRFLLNAPGEGDTSETGIQSAYRRSNIQSQEESEDDNSGQLRRAQREAIANLEFRRDVEEAMQKILSFEPSRRPVTEQRPRRIRGALGRALRAREAAIRRLGGGSDEYLLVESPDYSPRERLLNSLENAPTGLRASAPAVKKPVAVVREVVPSKNGSVAFNLQESVSANEGSIGFEPEPTARITGVRGSTHTANSKAVIVAPNRGIRVVNDGSKDSVSKSGVTRVGR